MTSWHESSNRMTFLCVQLSVVHTSWLTSSRQSPFTRWTYSRCAKALTAAANIIDVSTTERLVSSGGWSPEIWRPEIAVNGWLDILTSTSGGILSHDVAVEAKVTVGIWVWPDLTDWRSPTGVATDTRRISVNWTARWHYACDLISRGSVYWCNEVCNATMLRYLRTSGVLAIVWFMQSPRVQLAVKWAFRKIHHYLNSVSRGENSHIRRFS